MPSKSRDAARPTFYLDHSTLCDAFRAHLVGGATPADIAYRPLFDWVECVAKEANLCMSVIHIAELGRWGDSATADAMARWYEQLPIVWVRSMTDVQNAEDEHWTKVAAGIDPKGTVNPFAPSLLVAFHDLKGDALTQLLGTMEPIVALLEAIRVKGQQNEVRGMLEVAQAFRDDRAWAESVAWSDERKRDEIAYKRRVDLRTRAMEADRRLVARKDLDYAAAKACSGGDVQDLLVELFDKEPTALPCYRAVQRFNEGLISFAMTKEGGSKKERAALSGSFHDLVHLSVGAAYCDVFTCDGLVSDWLGPLRQALGLQPQLSAKKLGGPEPFVKALMSTWP